MEKKINSIYTTYNSLINLLHNILIENKTTKEDIFYSLFGIIVLDLIFNKEDMVKNKEGIIYESIMSDNLLEDMLKHLNIENIDKKNNGASIYATIRNKLAHGDYFLDNNEIIFNVNNKKCKVSIENFVNYYMELTNILKCRYNENKFVKHQLIDSSIGKFNKLIETREEVLEYLKFLKYKEFILRRKDNKNLRTEEKAFFIQTIYGLYNDKLSNEKLADDKLKNIFKNNYIININSKKLKKLKEEDLKEVEKIIAKNNQSYNYDIEAINNILYSSSEDIYKLVDKEYDYYSIKYGLANTKVILNEMIKNKIYDFNEFSSKRTNKDLYYLLGLPINEIIISIMLSLIYFNYCYPLEKIYKENKTFTNEYNDELKFDKLKLDELKPSINKLYEIEKDNVLKGEKIKIKSIKNKIEELNDKLDNKINQKKNLIKKYKINNDIKIKNVIDKLTIDINDIYNDFEYQIFLYNNEILKNEELKKYIMENDLNYYNYTIINGIRNSIAHGNIKCNNIASAKLKDVELEFIDEHDNDIKFSLKVTVDSLFSLLEIENVTCTNDYLKKKILK